MFHRNKKSCLTCAFCMRNRGYFDSSLLNINHNWSYDERSATKEEREKFLVGNFSIIGERIRQYKEWDKQYKEAENKYNKEYENQQKNLKKTLGFSIPLNPLSVCRMSNQSYLKNTISQEELNLLGINDPPENVPEYDRLACWQEQWTEKDITNDTINEQRNNLKTKHCDFYFPYNKKGNMSFEACEKQRQENIEKSRFLQSVILYPIITGLIVWAITYFVVK